MMEESDVIVFFGAVKQQQRHRRVGGAGSGSRARSLGGSVGRGWARVIADEVAVYDG